ncbi:hypothetical protein PPL_00630 [Heterostelium album PN500]|uniref:C2 domain-containing protein n=1 Tax=Heterostelium pallidum (strain ATCC 26659 / Pp 5 / PN500) TaxID=670386 RepID=D3AX02_HETP5|nr:hypothetical protein PPL_00630 [Heterostelium album PN500]EFA86825.1 hypothetical protein PPL_00630 [Heterostelium album PN500]|eukprot:XP_020438928.1 hypothetical protein PPL_00630 [Heterostelium album PN500]
MDNSSPRHLKLIVKDAKELKSNNFGGTSDPYVVVKCRSQTFKTDVIKDTKLPIWNYVVQLDSVDDSTYITFEIYDWERIGSHKLIGAVTVGIVELKDATVRGITDKWLQLDKKGYLNIYFEFNPPLMVTQQAQDGTVHVVPAAAAVSPVTTAPRWSALPAPVHLQPLYIQTIPSQNVVEFSTPGEIYHEKVYLTGTSFQSSIIYTVSDPQVVVRAMYVEFKGKVWSNHGKIKTLVSDSRDLLHTYNVQGPKRVSLPRGKHMFPFQFYIPKECKSSIVANDYRVQYVLTFYADIVNSPDVSVTKTVRIVNIEDTTLKQAAVPINAHASKTPLTGGAIDFRVLGPKNFFYPGEDIELEIQCSNNSKKTIKNVELSLLKTEEKYGVKTPYTLGKTNKAFYPKIYKGSKTNQYIVLETPSDITPSIYHKDVVSIDYQLIINLDIPSCVDINLKIPINIVFRDPAFQLSPDPLTEVSQIPRYLYDWDDRHTLSWLTYRMKAPPSVIEEFDRFNIQGFDIICFEESLLERMLSGAGERAPEILAALMEERNKIIGVRYLLKDLQLPGLIKCFEDHTITTDILPYLTEADLVSLKISIGDRKRILNAVSKQNQQLA